jgi:hypothetical protein
MIYDYILSTGDSTISGSLITGYTGHKAFASNFGETFYYNDGLISSEKEMQLSSNGQTFYEDIPIETQATNEKIYQAFSGDFFLKTGSTVFFDRNKLFTSSGTPFRAAYKVKYQKYTGSSAVGLGTGSDLGITLTSGISGVNTSLDFDGYDYFLNGQKIYSGVGIGVSAGVGTQFTLSFNSAYGGVLTAENKSNYKAFAFIKRDRVKQVSGSLPDVYGSGFIENQTTFYLNGLNELDENYLELYTGVNIIKAGEPAGLFNFGILGTSLNLVL